MLIPSLIQGLILDRVPQSRMVSYLLYRLLLSCYGYFPKFPVSLRPEIYDIFQYNIYIYAVLHFQR